ncbi:MAG TPA: hypothetical protein VGV14_10500 [Rhodanobacter sp.]|nr:hypothetical protein [Rhodanobacter sp.]
MLNNALSWLKAPHWRSLLVPLLILTFTLIAGSTAFSPSYRDCAKQQESQSGQQQKDGLFYQPGVIIYCEAVFSESNNGAITALATIFVAIFTLTLWLASVEQARLTRKSIEAAQKSSERQLRAYVFATATKLVDYEVGKRPWVHVRVKNHGQTPAYNFRQSYRAGFQDYPLTSQIPTTKDTSADFINIGPGGHVEVKIGLEEVFTVGKETLLKSGTKAFYFLGYVEYTDAFGNDQWLEYCFYVGGDQAPGMIAFYKGHNRISNAPST